MASAVDIYSAHPMRLPKRKVTGAICQATGFFKGAASLPIMKIGTITRFCSSFDGPDKPFAMAHGALIMNVRLETWTKNS